MANREEGAAAPNWRQGQDQSQHQDAVRQRHIHLNWSNFKPEFSGKLEEDAEPHLLCSNDWMNAHHFDEDIRVQKFCLTLLGEARLWYHSLEPLGNTMWAQLQNLFRQRYSKLGNTHEQLFHAWISFTFDENTETIDSYVIRITEVATLSGYGELQILEEFKNTLLTKLCCILFPIEDLRQVADMAKRILTKEKLDKQLTGQTPTSPFMSVRHGTDRRVSFNTREELRDKIDKLTVVMSKLAERIAMKESPLSHKYTQEEDKADLMVKEVPKPGQIVEIGDTLQIIVQGKIIEATDLEEISEDMVDKVIRENCRNEWYGSNNTDRNRSRERTLTRSYGNGRDRSSSNDRSRSGSKASTNRDRIRCYAHREYDHFVRDCPNSREERDLEQLQHMLNMEEQDHRLESSDGDYRSPLNL